MRGLLVSLLASVMFVAACGRGDGEPGGGAGTGGASGSGGKAGSSGSGGKPGGSGGTGGSASGGTSGSGGISGSGGATAGTGGSTSSEGGAPGTGGMAAGTGGAGAGDAAAPADAAGGSDTPAGEGFMGLPPPPPGMTKIFNGVDLNDWECIKGAWEVKDGAMWGHYGGEDLCRTKTDYSTFRVVFNENGGGSNNHMGFGFWGDHGGRYGNALVVIPPSGAIWDYVAPEKMLTGGVGSANNPIKHMWHQVEVLANRTTGEVWTAVNGKQVSYLKDTRANVRKHGPIGFQDHGGASNQFYRDIYIENEPKEMKLLTVKP
jgi:hypothetical protein